MLRQCPFFNPKIAHLPLSKGQSLHIATQLIRGVTADAGMHALLGAGVREMGAETFACLSDREKTKIQQ